MKPKTKTYLKTSAITTIVIYLFISYLNLDFVSHLIYFKNCFFESGENRLLIFCCFFIKLMFDGFLSANVFKNK